MTNSGATESYSYDNDRDRGLDLRSLSTLNEQQFYVPLGKVQDYNFPFTPGVGGVPLGTRDKDVEAAWNDEDGADGDGGGRGTLQKLIETLASLQGYTAMAAIAAIFASSQTGKDMTASDVLRSMAHQFLDSYAAYSDLLIALGGRRSISPSFDLGAIGEGHGVASISNLYSHLMNYINAIESSFESDTPVFIEKFYLDETGAAFKAIGVVGSIGGIL
jgi:hypothetical protein